MANITHRTVLLSRINWNYTQPTDMPFCVKPHLFVHYCIFGEYSDPSRPSQRDFTTPTLFQVFLRNLAITDLLVGIIVEPVHVA